MLGEKLRELREAKGLVQRQVAAELQVDTAYISKMENSEKPISRLHLKKLSKIYTVNEADLLSLWLADKILQVIEDEKYANEALMIVQNRISTKKE
ncbi:MAG TPA: helix-turn-helix transcriptional regulator [Chitinophaga sp.]|uniref:helix-turn-helix domain-containing protein n=1 Tax=Chitinophaga sp. TaxID=1869181 RepID=UPI002C87D23C|nr:helix-turn-helix transcriptional regulator [Chitinophaga sp.]HVI49248.1 helix-turn-helix transcriptional regulator [Chitinophaga sp.]